MGAAAAALFVASVAGSALVDDSATTTSGGLPATTTLPEISTTTTSSIDLFATTSTSIDDGTVTTATSIAPVVSGSTTTTTTGRSGTTSTTAAPSTGLATPSANTASCPVTTSQTTAGAALPATGITTVTVADGAVKVLSTTGRQPAWRSGADDILRIETAEGKDPALCLSAPDGSNLRPVTTPVGADGPVLSPDGTQVAVRAGVGGARVALVVGLVSGNARRTVLEGANVTDPTWLGNGTLVACLTPSGAGPRLIRVPSAGGSVVTVRDSCTGPTAGSPDGKRLAIPTPNSLDVIESDGRIITLPRTGLLPQPPSWSPDGDRVVYGYTDEGGRALGLFHLSGNIANQIARAEADHPAYSPKGDQILFTGRTSVGAPRRLLSVAPTGGTVRTVVTCAGRCLLPRSAWSPDGTRVAVDSAPGS